MRVIGEPPPLATRLTNLRLLIDTMPTTLIENKRHEADNIVMSVRFALLSFPLVGGLGTAATAERAKYLALRSLADRLCEVCVLNQEIVDMVERHGEKAIALVLDDVSELFEHLSEFITKSKKVPIRARISKQCFDPLLFPSEREMVSREMRASIGEFWKEQSIEWPTHWTTGNTSLSRRESASSEMEPVLRVKREVEEEDDDVVILEDPPPVTVKKEPRKSRRGTGEERAVQAVEVDSKPFLPLVVNICEEWMDEAASTRVHCEVHSEDEVDMEEQIQEKKMTFKRESVEANDNGSMKRARMAMEKEKRGGGGETTEQEKTGREGEVDEWRAAMETAASVPAPIEHDLPVEKRREEREWKTQWLHHIAKLIGTELQDDASFLRFKSISPAFVSVEKTKSLDAHGEMLSKLKEWRLLPGVGKEWCAVVDSHLPCLWALLHPLVAKCTTGDATKRWWKARELRDMAARFWTRPAHITTVHFPLSVRAEAGTVEYACEKMVESLAQQACLEVVSERRDDCVRLQFLSFPVELLGSVEYVEWSSVYSSFVRSLCDVGFLPPWWELLYLLMGQDSGVWRAELSRTMARGVIQCFRGDYLLKAFGDPSSPDRIRLRVYLEDRWKHPSSTVTVPRAIKSQFSLSFRVEWSDGGGEGAWPVGAPALTEERWLEWQEKRGQSRVLHSLGARTPMHGAITPATPRWGTSSPCHGLLLTPRYEEATDFVPPPPSLPDFGMPPRRFSVPAPETQKQREKREKRERKEKKKQEEQEKEQKRQKENRNKEMMESYAVIVKRKLRPMSDSDGSAWLKLAGVSANLVCGRERNGRDMHEDMMHRLRALNLWPAHLYDKVLKENRPVASQLRALFSLVNDWIVQFNDTDDAPNNKRLLCLISDTAQEFWRMKERGDIARLKLVKECEWEEGEGKETAEQYQSRLGRWFLPRLAAHLGTRLVHATTNKGGCLLWLRAISHDDLGVTARRDTCEFAYLMRRLSGRKLISFIEKFKNIMTDEAVLRREMAKSSLAMTAAVKGKLIKVCHDWTPPGTEKEQQRKRHKEQEKEKARWSGSEIGALKEKSGGKNGEERREEDRKKPREGGNTGNGKRQKRSGWR